LGWNNIVNYRDKLHKYMEIEKKVEIKWIIVDNKGYALSLIFQAQCGKHILHNCAQTFTKLEESQESQWHKNANNS
jgi:hypothetical protein